MVISFEQAPPRPDQPGTGAVPVCAIMTVQRSCGIAAQDSNPAGTGCHPLIVPLDSMLTTDEAQRRCDRCGERDSANYAQR
jgi:hypothetical protein